MKPKYVTEAIESIEQDSSVPQPTKEKLIKILERALSPLDTDKWIYRMVVGALGLAILTCLVFSFFVSLKTSEPNVSVEMPEIFMAIGSAAVGALAGLLAPSPGRGGDSS